ncbi:YceI family protein [Psychroserpens ponticola]|uniref:YceI family protein n=1 Tax=Psychroserpens ponticola TaxID=2932268 RepID=A0ABY7S296_9FLAO|nr:YceI family protein [Psychroserpens ponticola]WCO03125.1 YceI family protein [Psychroserpens ponticola]
MKTIFTTIALLLSTFSILNSQEKLNIDSSKSQLKWFGEYTFYFGGHEGYMNFEEGYFIKTDDAITGGEFIINMNSILCLDIEDEEANEGLVNHLKDPDFFDVAKFPKASMVITNVDYHNSNHMKIYADLTIKGITKPISFQAEVDFAKKQMTTKFKIDRMKWGISYNSDIKDSAISDAIGFDVKLSL